MLTGRIHTWFAFPEWFTYKEPVNTLTVPRPTPGGLTSQFSSIGHYDLADDQAMIVTVISSLPPMPRPAGYTTSSASTGRLRSLTRQSGTDHTARLMIINQAHRLDERISRGRSDKAPATLPEVLSQLYRNPLSMSRIYWLKTPEIVS